MPWNIWRIFKFTIISTIILGAFWISGKLSTERLYGEYSTLWDYRRLHPDFLPSAETEKIMSVGHETTYADISWIKLIQFIGDNIGNGKYLDFTHTILVSITELHPYFTRAYEMDLIMAPLIYPEEKAETVQKYETLIRGILSHGEQGVATTCDQKKLEEIANAPVWKTLWERQDLRNPCIDGMIPYYIGYHYSNVFHDGAKAEYYYKIASMQDDAPKASEFLSIIAKSSEGNYRDSALSFFLIAADGYDIEPFACQKLANTLITDLSEKRPFTASWIAEIWTAESKLRDNKDQKHPESYANNNCFDSIERGIKQLYIGYIAEVGNKHPEITDSRDLVKQWIIKAVPTIQTQKDFYLIKKETGWKYKTDNPFQ